MVNSVIYISACDGLQMLDCLKAKTSRWAVAWLFFHKFLLVFFDWSLITIEILCCVLQLMLCPSLMFFMVKFTFLVLPVRLFLLALLEHLCHAIRDHLNHGWMNVVSKFNQALFRQFKSYYCHSVIQVTCLCYNTWAVEHFPALEMLSRLICTTQDSV